MVNVRRGEIEADIDGERHVLRLTLGALCALEQALAEPDLVALVARFETGRVSARDILAVVGAGLRGGGAKIDDAQLARIVHPQGLQGWVAIAARLLASTFGADDAPAEPAAVPPSPQGAKA